jgi:hypothetical protein
VPELVRSPEAQAGFLTSLDRFAGYLATRTGRTGAGAPGIGHRSASPGERR